MSYVAPISTSIASLKGIDLRIQNIQAKVITYVTWVTHSFGLADRVVKREGNINNIFPAVYISNAADPLSMLPSDQYTAFCFWVKEAEAKVKDYQYTGITNPPLTYNVSCIFFCDLARVSTTLTWKATKSKVRLETFKFFKNNCIGLDLTLKLLSIVDDDITKVYAGFSMDQIDNRFMMMPNYGIRYNFELTFNPECS